MSKDKLSNIEEDAPGACHRWLGFPQGGLHLHPQVSLWAIHSPNATVKILAASTGLKVTTALTTTKSCRYKMLPIQERAIEEQQRIAETCLRLGLLPKRIWVEDAI